MFRPIYRPSSDMFHKNITTFLELGCPNMDPYYVVGICYYLVNVPWDNVNKTPPMVSPPYCGGGV
jgi:hypothetical protein